MSKSHYWLGTSQNVGYLNEKIRNKWVIVELAGFLHESLRVVRHEATKPWVFHCLEGRPAGKFAAGPGDEALLSDDGCPIDPAWLEGAADFVVKKFKVFVDVVTDFGKSSTGLCVGIFEGRYGPKEEGVARAKRDADI